jgi:hypothetical protein
MQSATATWFEASETEGAPGAAGVSLRPRRSKLRLAAEPARATLRWTEALELPGAVLPELPLPPTIDVRVAGISGVVRLDTGARSACAEGLGGQRERGERGQDARVQIEAEEWRAIVLGAEADRLFARDFLALCARKRSDPTWRIDLESTLAGARPDANERWSAWRILDRIGARVVAIHLEAA